MSFKKSLFGIRAIAAVSVAMLAFAVNPSLANDAGFDGDSKQPSARSAEKNADNRYELNRSESILLINLDIDGELMAKADYLHFENVFTGQTYRVKMRSGTHLLKVDAGVYRADLTRLNQRLYGRTVTDGSGVELPSTADLTLMPQTINFAGSWSFTSQDDLSDLTISDERNPAFAIAQKYPQISKYPLRANAGASTKLVAFDWPLESREVVSFRQQ